MRFVKLRWVLVLAVMFACAAFCTAAFAQGEGERASRARQTGGAQAAEVIVTLNEGFLNSFLDAMFTRLRGPQFPLSLAGLELPPEAAGASPSVEELSAHRQIGFSLKRAPTFRARVPQCASVIVLEREMGGTRTAVRFENGRISAPLAFSGSYSVALLGCIRFQGWAETTIKLEFDRARQSLSARVEVLDIHLSGVPSLANGVVVGLVQNSIDRRINPVEILQAAQLSARIPIAASGGALRLMAKEVRPEVVQGSLRLHIIYEFTQAD